jgi:hypothetical protein
MSGYPRQPLADCSAVPLGSLVGRSVSCRCVRLRSASALPLSPPPRSAAAAAGGPAPRSSAIHRPIRSFAHGSVAVLHAIDSRFVRLSFSLTPFSTFGPLPLFSFFSPYLPFLTHPLRPLLDNWLLPESNTHFIFDTIDSIQAFIASIGQLTPFSWPLNASLTLGPFLHASHPPLTPCLATQLNSKAHAAHKVPCHTSHTATTVTIASSLTRTIS